jgi:hypothetical protein
VETAVSLLTAAPVLDSWESWASSDHVPMSSALIVDGGVILIRNPQKATIILELGALKNTGPHRVKRHLR